VSDRRDELDMLAAIVNRMLDQIERLLGEVKGVSDSIAHDLRTPLTRLRAQLHRIRQLGGEGEGESEGSGDLVERCIVEADALLDRFRALLRISELEDISRRGGFGVVDARDTLRRVHELYVPLAEEKDIAFVLQDGPPLALRGDGHLLFEAIGNLVDNAIKFAPRAGHVGLCARREGDHVFIEVSDDGGGIAPEEREKVLRRFYRGASSAGDVPGHGLGLPLVAAIARLHGQDLGINDQSPRGTRMVLRCAAVDD
jgi:signal transduction histidine kinase